MTNSGEDELDVAAPTAVREVSAARPRRKTPGWLMCADLPDAELIKAPKLATIEVVSATSQAIQPSPSEGSDSPVEKPFLSPTENTTAASARDRQRTTASCCGENHLDSTALVARAIVELVPIRGGVPTSVAEPRNAASLAAYPTISRRPNSRPVQPGPRQPLSSAPEAVSYALIPDKPLAPMQYSVS